MKNTGNTGIRQALTTARSKGKKRAGRLLPLALCLCAGITSLAVAAASAGESPAKTVILNGGRIEPVDITTVRTSTDHLNFCFANRFPDGTIILNNSGGVHTKSEYGMRSVSLDNGKTWKDFQSEFKGINSWLSLDGKKSRIDCWNREQKDRHEITRVVLSDDMQSVEKFKTPLILPFKSSVHLHRDVIRLADGRLVAPGYGRKEGEAKAHTFLLDSEDDGRTWRFLATAAENLEGKIAEIRNYEGPNESTLVQLENGDLLLWYRVASIGPLSQARSTDGGRTWGEREEIAPFDASPHAIRLQNGALVLVSGRPNTYLLVDFAGEGKAWQSYRVWGESGSCYASVLEIEPNRVMVIYDESDAGAQKGPGVFNRISALTLDIVRDDSLRRAESEYDALARGYENFFHAGNRRDPSASGFTPAGYQPEGAQNRTEYYEFHEIAERPHPVLRLEHRAPDDSPARFAHFRAPLPRNIPRFEADFEFRLSDLGEKRPQFSISFSMAKPGDVPGSLTGGINFARESLVYRDAGRSVALPFNADGGFRAYTLRVDRNAGSYALFAKTAPDKALFTAAFGQSDAASDHFQWGDGSHGVAGAVDLSYIGWKWTH